MKIKALLEAAPVLARLNEQKMPAKLAYALAKNFRLISQEIEDYEKARIKFLSDNWMLVKKTNQFKIPPADQQKFQDGINELVDAEVTLQPYTVVFTLLEAIQISPAEIMAIDWMITDSPEQGE